MHAGQSYLCANLNCIDATFGRVAFKAPMHQPNGPTQEIWNGLRDTTQILFDEVEFRLREAGLPSMSWYDVLHEVDQSGPIGVRPVELQERLSLPQYVTSRLSDRMARAGLVDRARIAADGRGQLILITRLGQSVRKRMWAIYCAFLAERVEGALDPDETTVFLALLGKLRRRAAGATSAASEAAGRAGPEDPSLKAQSPAPMAGL